VNGCDAIRLLTLVPDRSVCRSFAFVTSSGRGKPRAATRHEAQAARSPEVSDLTGLASRSSVEIEMLAMANGVIKPLDIGSPPFIVELRELQPESQCGQRQENVCGARRDTASGALKTPAYLVFSAA